MISARGVNTVCMVEMNYQFSFSLVFCFYSTLWKPEAKSLKTMNIGNVYMPVFNARKWTCYLLPNMSTSQPLNTYMYIWIGVSDKVVRHHHFAGLRWRCIYLFIVPWIRHHDFDDGSPSEKKRWRDISSAGRLERGKKKWKSKVRYMNCTAGCIKTPVSV